MITISGQTSEDDVSDRGCLLAATRRWLLTFVERVSRLLSEVCGVGMKSAIHSLGRQVINTSAGSILDAFHQSSMR